MALVLSILTLLFCLAALGDYHKPAELTGPEIILGFTFYPVTLLAVGLLLYGAFQATRPTRRGYYVAVALCSLPLSSLFAYGFVRQSRVDHMALQISEWADVPDRIADVFLDYYHSHPDRIHRIGNSEEVSVDGFAPFCLTRPDLQSLALKSKADQILDYVGKPIRFFVDFNADGRAENIPVIAGAVSVSDSQVMRNGSSPRDPHKKADWEEFLRTGKISRLLKPPSDSK